MSTWQKIAFPLLILALILVIVFFWGSVASALAAFMILNCLIIYLWNRFINIDRDSEFDDFN